VTDRTRRVVPLLFAAALVAATSGCGRAPSSSAETSESGAAADASEKGTPDKVNLEEIFPAGPGRDLVLENCQNCHTFVPIVVLQMDKDGWQRNSLDHRERVTSLTDEQFKTVYDYLSTNFGPHRPVPRLPKALLKTWTGY
jgi:mono/diheme cytochrome c family protein